MDPATLVGRRVIGSRTFSAEIDGATETLLYLSFEDGQRVCLLMAAPTAPKPASVDAEDARLVERDGPKPGGGESSAAHA